MSLRNCLVVVWVYIVYIVGTCLFLSGYLLKHHIVYQNSTLDISIGNSINCNDFISLHNLHEEFIHSLEVSDINEEKKNCLQRFDKAVIIIIDALRYDFVNNSVSNHKDEEFYLNKMPVFKKMVKKFPQNSVLLPLFADPPTTTSQRLKGITTGSLPTFIDISKNFASSEIIEDNFIRQLNRLNKRIVFMGDDTWDNIFPGHFTRSYFYPSFNVKDLDTVDNGILDNIYKEIEHNNTDVLIAHFLGVDHCGHRYGPKHPEMTRKLLQMNSIILKIIEALKKDTLLFVLGDHGMTNTGDHGGDSAKETSTALFLYSPSKIIYHSKVMLTRSAVFMIVTMSIILVLFPILSEKPWTLTSKEIYSESLGSLIFIVLQLLYLIAGDAVSSAITLMSASLLLCAILSDLSTKAGESQLWIDVLIWNLSSRYWFYASAHQATFSSVQWDAAFLLNHKEIYSYTLSCILVIINTFASNILHGMALPAILISSKPTACSTTSIRRLYLKYMFCFGIKLLGHATAALILRRHLMAWKIFSPRLLYEIMGTLITMAASCIGHYFILSVISQYHKQIRKNLGHMFSDKNE